MLCNAVIIAFWLCHDLVLLWLKACHEIAVLTSLETILYVNMYQWVHQLDLSASGSVKTYTAQPWEAQTVQQQVTLLHAHASRLQCAELTHIIQHLVHIPCLCS